MSNELEKARQQLEAGQYKKALNTLWEAERWARDDIFEARGLLQAASVVRDQSKGRVQEEATDLIALAEKYIKRAEESRGRVELGTAKYLGGSDDLGPASDGRLAFTTDAVFLGSSKLDLTEVSSVDLGGGEVAKSRLGATLALGLAGLATKGTEDRTEMAIHLKNGDAAFFVLERVSPFEIRAKLTPLLRERGIPFHDEVDSETSAPEDAPGQAPAPSLVDELAKLAQLHESGFLSDDEVAAAKAKLLS